MHGHRNAAVLAGLLVLGLTAAGPASATSTESPATGAPAAAVTSFSDIGPGDAFYEDVAWMTTAGITTGWPDGTFRPTAPVTREAMAAFLARWVFEPVIPPCDPSTPRVFPDVTAGNPFCSAIEWLSEFAVTGYPDGTFRPSAPLTRGAFAAIMMRGYKASATCDPATPRVFTDIPASNPFCGYIESAAARGIVKGWPDGTFRPSLLISRQAIAAMLHRAEISQSADVSNLAGTWVGVS